ncbi:MAG: dinitrogenase iron-molybdenum cofactor biosynthesis protein [candidate division Zixibacteria bacterium DG_27]|nr:MAG: dinitrogenase iron-molybdenum cofactor biosynthesis protein [candidate division Zixibacteria bacterium DG_27]
MKIAITSQGDQLSSEVDPRFGRCLYFLIVDSETDSFEAVQNPAVGAGGGAGIQASQLVLDKGVEAVVTGNVGPNAFRTLQGAGIKVYGGASGTIEESLKSFKEGKLQDLSNASVPGHFGMRGGQSPV